MSEAITCRHCGEQLIVSRCRHCEGYGAVKGKYCRDCKGGGEVCFRCERPN